MQEWPTYQLDDQLVVEKEPRCRACVLEPFVVGDVDGVQGDFGGDRGGHLGNRVDGAQEPGGRQGQAARGDLEGRGEASQEEGEQGGFDCTAAVGGSDQKVREGGDFSSRVTSHIKS